MPKTIYKVIILDNSFEEDLQKMIAKKTMNSHLKIFDPITWEKNRKRS